jgi:hypothetical protein
MESQTEKILLQTLNGKNRSLISRKKYDLLSGFIMEMVSARKEISFTELMETAEERFRHEFSNELNMLLLHTKRDLEARQSIEIRYKRNRTQLISLKMKPEQTNLAGNVMVNRRSTEGNYIAHRKNWMKTIERQQNAII